MTNSFYEKSVTLTGQSFEADKTTCSTTILEIYSMEDWIYLGSKWNFGGHCNLESLKVKVSVVTVVMGIEM